MYFLKISEDTEIQAVCQGLDDFGAMQCLGPFSYLTNSQSYFF